MNLSRQGQSCSSTSRVLVNKKVKEKFLKSLVEKAKSIPIGLPWIETNEIGPIVSKKQFEGVMNYIKSGVEQGAKLLLGGDQNKSGELKNGFFVNATIFCDVKPDMKIAKEILITPNQMAEKYNIAGGHWHHGDLEIDQLLMMRPFYGSAQYSTPINGLYLCSAGTHPGGGLTGINGLNAAKKVIEDFK